MPKNKPNQTLANEWIDSAKSDYQYAEVGVREKQIFPQVAFLSQQVTEKLLKGFLLLNGVEPPRIHELPKLLDKCIYPSHLNLQLLNYKEWHHKSLLRLVEFANSFGLGIKVNPQLEELRDACELLTGFYIETRYPPDIPNYSKEEIKEAFENARRVKEKIEEVIDKEKNKRKRKVKVKD